MNKDFEWLKWLGLAIVVSLLGAFYYLKNNNARTDDSVVLQTISLEQTEQFIDRIDKLQAKDSTVNLEYTPDVAQHSREYNSLVEDAERIYGITDLSNDYRFCTSMASFAREMWNAKYSNLSTTQEYKDRTQKMFLESYNQAKKDCLAEIESKQ
ncbi:hypothetical protein MN869_18575 [Acinetobacter sp. NIPH1876]|uniref:hypothetical protein n=1 Tax=Acinetobacter sp. NIPH1876 TaxID=2924041 RepID=UPI001FAD845D|nr:hypothetical protein [Acinetobacter sp. NIPH1876]MCJ0830423.1 hypothetical protein [Acinetobacter sp. NIPH1876]